MSHKSGSATFVGSVPAGHDAALVDHVPALVRHDFDPGPAVLRRAARTFVTRGHVVDDGRNVGHANLHSRDANCVLQRIVEQVLAWPRAAAGSAARA